MPPAETSPVVIERPNFISLEYVEGLTIPQPISDAHMFLLWHAVRTIYNPNTKGANETSLVNLTIGSIIKKGELSDRDQCNDTVLAALRNVCTDKLLINRYDDGGYIYERKPVTRDLAHGHVTTRALNISGLGLQIARESARLALISEGTHHVRRISANTVFELSNTALVRGMLRHSLSDPQPL